MAASLLIVNKVSMTAPSLWDKAIESLSDEEKSDIDFSRTDKLSTLNDILAAVERGKKKCIEKQWKYRRGGHDVIIRDKLEKVVTWVNKFKEAGDTIVQYDPGHAALPWAAVRFLLQITINDSQIYGAMVDGVEYASNLITRYAILETIYLDSSTNTKPAAYDQLQAYITKLYASILTYLAKARRYYDKGTAERMTSALIRTPGSSVDSYLKNIKDAQVDVDASIRLVNAEKNQDLNKGMKQLIHDFEKLSGESADVKDVMKRLEAVLYQLDHPISRQATRISDRHDSLDRENRQKLLRWLSTIPHRAHHTAMGTGFLPNSGQWLIRKREFVEWRKSSVSSVLWLRGIPGSGKTKLVYSVIEHLQNESTNTQSPAPIAFFYCVRAEGEPQRADPDEILRCILKQLSCSKATLPIREPVARVFKRRKEEAEDNGDDPAKLTVVECESMIISLLEQNPATIIIDALDECDPKRRFEIFRTLDNIIQKSPSLVKVFVSSREDSDIVCRLEKSPNILIDAMDNGQDIDRFVHTEVDKAVIDKRLLGGVVSEALYDKIVNRLIRGANGMFRWVSLQIENLCDPERMNHENDVEQELGRLPKTLHDSYRIIHDRTKTSGLTSRSMAHRVIAWLLCARYPLKSSEFIDAVSKDIDGRHHEVSRRDLLNMCCNLVVWDQTTDIFRFAHLSVQEYFQSQEEYSKEKINDIAVMSCVNIFIARASLESNSGGSLELSANPQIFVNYASFNWIYHCDASGNPKCKGRVKQFFFQESQISPSFKLWMSTLKKYNDDFHRGPVNSSIVFLHSLYSYILPAICTPPTPLLLACTYGWNDVLEHLSTFSHINWNQLNDHGTTSALRLALKCQDLRNAQILLKQGADIHTVYRGGWSLLFDDTSKRHSEAIKLLLDAGIDVDAVDLSGGSALSSLGLKGNYDIKIARMLLSANANPALIDKEGKTALQHLCDRFDDTFQSSDPPDYPKDGVGGINLLLDQVTDINEPGYDAVQIIRIAAVNGWTNVARGLLRAKYQINAIDDFGSTAMQIAAHNGKPDVVRLLLTVEGVDLNLENFDGWTPLRSATDFCHPEIVQMLITAGADPNIHTDGTATALYQAAESGNVEILQMLLDAGADPNLEITSKGGPSRGEAEAGNLEMFKLLLVTGADDRLCQTALHIAAKMGHLDVVEALLAANANVSALNDFGWRASELATEWGHHHVAQVLIAAEGKTQTSSGPFKGFVLTDDWRFREWDEDDEVDMLQKDLQEVSGRIEHDYTTVE